MGTIVVKNVDRDVYRHLKSVAALKGCTVGEALTEAMRLWLTLNEAISRDYLEYLIRREKSERKLEEVQREYGERFKGRYAVICDGKLVNICESEEEAFEVASKSGGRQCIIARLGEPAKEKRVELGMGVLT